ncbi:hypothetical protein LTR09_004417 [Extremus antarcticus]|uniref:RNA helicase n=1 Tax=Extremus antarcticus TaxID=702011 RepID=A0AAJ0DIU9_9PEZI|nr:hypothetical protein LTR09_004417 [Extremus antarcticus]
MDATAGDKATTLDVYARAFVPQSLRQVNLVPANVVLSLPTQGFDYQAYVQTFAGTNWLPAADLLPLERGGTGNNSPIGNVRGSSSSPPKTDARTGVTDQDALPPRTLGPDSYHEFFQAALIQEGNALLQECEDHALYRVPITWAWNDSRPFMFILHVPGLRESNFRIEIGDIVQLRQLRFDQQWNVICGSMVRDQQGKTITAPFHIDTQHNSVVWGIDRREETLRLRIEGLHFGSMLFNVRFTVQAERVRAIYTGVITAQRALNAGPNANWMRSILFPEDGDGYYQKSLNRRNIDLEFRDPLLNYEQSRAINTVLSEKYGPVPYVISGPPGTGKTKTIVELALQLIHRNEATHLLICAPSDPAADTLVRRLSAHLNPPQLLRVNAASRSFPEVSDMILPYCYVEDGIFSLPSFAQLMKCKALVTTCDDANILLQARVSNRDLFALESNLHNAMHPEAAKHHPKLHWTGLLMDEAAQATEPEALIPITVMTPPAAVEEEDWPLFVMAGDQHQLGPRTASKTPAMQTSLFERLLDRPFYRDHLLARSKWSGGVVRPLTQAMLPILRPAFANLIRNYRSHPSILAMPSSLFYHDTLEPEATDIRSLLSWPGWKGRGWPVLFVRNTAADEIEQEGGGWYNLQEAKIACEYAKSVVQACLVQPSEICIMSPFQAQVKVLRRIARTDFAMPGFNIGPLEAFQGLESRLVIICTTRTRDRFIDQDIARGLGVIHEPKRFNVALTRAKEGLIVIGNSDVLVKDDNWAAWLGFCHRNGLCEDELDRLRSYEGGGNAYERSRLEKQLILAEDADNEVHATANGVRKLGFANNLDDALWRSGIAAEQLVRQESGDAVSEL